MKIKSRLFVAAILVGILVVVAGGVWAAPVFRSTGEDKNTTGGNGDVVGTSGVTCDGCTIEIVEEPEGLADLPSGEKVGDAIQVTLAGGKAQITYNVPPGTKNPKIYRLDTSKTPNVWVEINPAAVLSADGKTLVFEAAENGTYIMMGDS